LKRVLQIPEIGRLADAAATIARDDQRVNWASLIAALLLSWLGIALAVGTIVGRGIAFGTRTDLN
jgi:hypothetical protein